MKYWRKQFGTKITTRVVLNSITVIQIEARHAKQHRRRFECLYRRAGL